MDKRWFAAKVALVGVVFALAASTSEPARAADADEINLKSAAALESLLASQAGAKALHDAAVATLVFPEIVKAGLIIGGQIGVGALIKKEEGPAAYYRSAAASYGLQAGIRKFGYVLFFMNDDSLSYLDKSDGWEIGVGPNIVVVDQGAAGAITTTTGRSDIYAFIFDQKGLLAGLGTHGRLGYRRHEDHENQSRLGPRQVLLRRSSPVMKSRFDQSVSGATMMMITSMAGLPSMFATMAIARAASN